MKVRCLSTMHTVGADVAAQHLRDNSAKEHAASAQQAARSDGRCWHNHVGCGSHGSTAEVLSCCCSAVRAVPKASEHVLGACIDQ